MSNSKLPFSESANVELLSRSIANKKSFTMMSYPVHPGAKRLAWSEGGPVLPDASPVLSSNLKAWIKIMHRVKTKITTRLCEPRHYWLKDLFIDCRRFHYGKWYLECPHWVMLWVHSAAVKSTSADRSGSGSFSECSCYCGGLAASIYKRNDHQHSHTKSKSHWNLAHSNNIPEVKILLICFYRGTDL